MNDGEELKQLRQQLDQIHQLADDLASRLARLEGQATKAESTESKVAQPPARPTPTIAKTTAADQPLEKMASPSSSRVASSFAKTVATSLALTRIGPLAEFQDMCVATYRHYEAQGKTAAFMMTAAGIVALLVGFGYLLQFTFNNLFGELARVIFATLLASGVVGLGLRIHLKRDRLQEYASAILAMGLVMYFLCICFAAFYYTLLSEPASLVLFGLVTLGGFVLAQWLETRVVAVITVIGGSFGPFLVSAADITATHLGMQLLITIGLIVLNRQLRWPALLQLGFVSAVVVLETYLLGGYQALPITLYLLAIFYLFSGVTLRNLQQSERNGPLLQVLVLNLFVFAFGWWQLFEQSNLGGLGYLANALVFAAAFTLCLRLAANRNLLAVLSLYVLVLVGCGIFVLADAELYGALFGAEGVALLWLGLRFDNRMIRHQAYVGVLIGVATSCYSLVQWLTTPQGNIWLTLFALGITLTAARLILLRHDNRLEAVDKLPGTVIDALLSLWVVLATLLSTYLLLPGFTLASAFVAGSILLFRAVRTGSRFSHYLALVCFALLLPAVVSGMLETGSVLFRHLPLPARVSLLELAIVAWGLLWFYDRFEVAKPPLKLAYTIRQIFYVVLPLLPLPRILRSYPEWLPIALWGATAASLLLYYFVRSRPIQVEAQCLTWLAALVSVIAVALGLTGSLGQSALTLLTGMSLVVFVIWRTNGIQRFIELEQPFRTFVLTGFIFGAMTIVATVGELSVTLANPVLGLLFVIYLRLAHRFSPLHYLVRFSLYSAIVAIALVLANHLMTSHSSLGATHAVALVLIALYTLYLVYSRWPAARLLHTWRPAYPYQLCLAHGVVFVSYVLLTQMYTGNLFGPAVSLAMLLHATAILFSTRQAAFRVGLPIAQVMFAAVVLKAFIIDLNDFSLVEKVMAFIGMGVILLVGAYWYQKPGLSSGSDGTAR